MTPQLELLNLAGKLVTIQVLGGGSNGGAFIKEARVVLASETHLWLNVKMLGGSVTILPWSSVAFLVVSDKQDAPSTIGQIDEHKQSIQDDEMAKHYLMEE